MASTIPSPVSCRQFQFPNWAQVWVPLAWTGRIAPFAVITTISSSLVSSLPLISAKPKPSSRAVSTRLEQLYPEDDKGWGAIILPLREQLVGDVRPALLVLLGAVAFVLLIACANVANLVLAKTLARRKEIAIRNRPRRHPPRHCAQVLSETVLLSVTGGALGLFSRALWRYP